MRSTHRLVFAAAALLGATAIARADVDLTGSWNVTVSFPGTTVTWDAVQSGPTLTLGPFNGTIDPSTGVFSLLGPPAPGGVIGNLVYGPSPAPTIDATASADGTTFEGTTLFWIIKVTPPLDFIHFPWFGLSSSLHGERRNLDLCGNGAIDVGEFCDDGAGNGTDGCCSALCTVVDADHDGVCDAADDCPTIYDPIQSCAVPLQPTSARVSGAGRVTLRGTMSRLIGSFATATLWVATAHVDGVLQCTGDPLNYVSVRCATPDGTLRMRLRRATTQDDWGVTLTATGVPVVSPPEGPVRAEVVDTANSRIARGELTNCTARGRRLSCTP